jgi:hypothetical protein
VELNKRRFGVFRRMISVDISVEDVIKHARERDYMSGVERNKARVKSTGEVFTPTELVNEFLDTLDQDLFRDPEKTFIDNACGDGQFLSEVLIRKMQNGIDYITAISTIFGVEKEQDNANECRKRLLCGIEMPETKLLVKQNIVCADSLTYHYRFDGTAHDVTDMEAKIIFGVNSLNVCSSGNFT